MKLQEWENWYTFATYLQGASINLHQTARDMMKFGFAECVMLYDGTTYWKSKEGFQQGLTTMTVEPHVIQ